MRLLIGDPVEAMEASKGIIGSHFGPTPDLLLEIAADDGYRVWSRVAAVYAIGLSGSKRSAPYLIKLLEARKEPPLLRSHAAEALGNLGSTRAVDALATALAVENSRSLKRSCVYALSQIRTPRSRAILEAASTSRLSGLVRKEVDTALKKGKVNPASAKSIRALE